MKEVKYFCDNCKEEFKDGMKDGHFSPFVAGNTSHHSLEFVDRRGRKRDLCVACMTKKVTSYMEV